MMESPSEPTAGMSRRGFLKAGATASAALGVAGVAGVPAAADDDPAGKAPARSQQERFMGGVPFEPHETVRVALVGLGMRGSGMVGRFLNVPGVQVTALCDINPDKLARDRQRVINAGQPEPATFLGEDSFEQLVQRDNIDFVYGATPWEYHYIHAKLAMDHGKHVGIELPMAMDLNDIWDLVKTSERTRRHCMTFHNRSYGEPQMRMLRIVHEGRLGEPLYGSGGYIHDLRSLNFSDRHEPAGWRRLWHTRMNTNLYPVHGLAPVSNAMKINRGDRYEWLTSVASPEAGYSEYRETLPSDHPSWGEEYITGDTNQCFITTAKGRFIRSEHDVSSPHPYSRANFFQASKGKLTEDQDSSFANDWVIYVEPDHSNHRWRDFDDYREYDHWLYQVARGPSSERPPGLSADANQMVVWRTMQCVRLGLPPDIDVYDSATWSSPIPLCAESLKRGSRPVRVPDFTRGHWQEDRPGMNSEQPDEM